MATLTSEEKQKIRNAVARESVEANVPIRWVKGALNDSAQAVEDLIVNSATAISNAINAASESYGITFTATEKRWIVALTVLMKHNRDMVGIEAQEKAVGDDWVYKADIEHVW